MFTDQMRRHGTFLFRWRSYVPAAMLPLMIIGLSQFQLPGGSYTLDLLWEFACFGLALFGLGVRALTVGSAPRGTSGRNTQRIKAEALNTRGMYSVARHPLYLANFIIFVAVLANLHAGYILAIGSLLYWLYYERIIVAEEAMLQKSHPEQFARWAAATPAIWPRLSGWQPPALPFSFRTALRREYTTFFAVITAFTFVETLGHSVVNGRLVHEPIWTAIFVAALGLYLFCRFLKKNTRALHVPGR